MDAKLKAKELVRSFSFIEYNQITGKKIFNKTLTDVAKQCALIAVDEIIDLLENALIKWHILNTEDEILDFWQQVKKEIQHYKY